MPNVGPYIYTTLAFLALLGAPYIYDISSLRVKKKGGSCKTVRTPQNIDAVRASFEEIPRRSAVRHSKKLGLLESSVRRILHVELHFHPYKIQVVQTLEEGDAAKRLVFS